MAPGPVRHALILADGSVPEPGLLDLTWPGWSDGVDLLIAADGGARHAVGFGRAIDLWVGDGDSLGAEGLARLIAAGVPVRRSPVDKDESDTELALLAALDAGAARVTVVGALGGERVDHGLANIWLLGHPSLAGCDIRLLDASVRIRLVGPGRVDLGGPIGDLISLLPFGGDALGLTTAGLRYPLRDEALPSGPSRGLSNVREAGDASLTVRSGQILVAETPATFSK